MIYTSDKNTRLTLRLNSDQFTFLKGSADVLGISPSEFLRMVINTTMMANKYASEEAQKEKEKEEARRENETSNINDKL